MRSVLAAIVAASMFLVPAAAQARSGHVDHGLRASYQKAYREVARRHRALDLKGPGCNLFSTCHQRATSESVSRSLATLRQMLYVPPPPRVAHTAASSSALTSAVAPALSAPSTGGCGDLPAYIVQRESGGDPNAVSPNGQYIGCGQVDRSHFAPGGACAGLGYTACVDKLWDHGRGASNWPTAANPPG